MYTPFNSGSLRRAFAHVSLRYKSEFSDWKFVRMFVISLVLLAGSMILNYFMAAYAFERSSSPVADIVLSNTPVFDVGWMFVWAPVIFYLVMVVVLLRDPKLIPYTLKSLALFIAVRSVFISLTHLGPFPDHVVLSALDGSPFASTPNRDFFFMFSSGADLFFSGHTGQPFLMAIIFWHKRWIRIFCLLATVFFSAIVLLGHLHYSIDVASAIFITYALSHIAERLFPGDWERFYEGQLENEKIKIPRIKA